MKEPRIVLRQGDYRTLLIRVVLGKECACGCGRRADSAHHLVRRGGHWQGDDVEENLIPLAGDGTRLCHGAITSKQRTYDSHRDEYISPGEVLAGIREFITVERPEKAAYVISKTSEGWLDEMYPQPTEGGPCTASD